MKTPNAYGAKIVTVERLSHPKSLTWRRVTWETPEGKQHTAKTFPGGTANRQAEDHPEGEPATIILNGRSQIIHIETFQVDGTMDDMNENLSKDQFGYKVVTYHADKSGKPRAKVRGTYEYDEDASAAAEHIANTDGSVLPNVGESTDHPRYGEYNRSAWVGGNRMAVVYLKGQSKYRSG